MIGQWENDGVKMIGVAENDGLNDKEEDDMIQAHDISDKVGANVDNGPSTEEYDEIAMVDEDVKRMIDLATKL